MPCQIVQMTCLFLSGLLAGEELVIRYGVRGPLAAMAVAPQIALRQSLILRLRILVPAIAVPTFVSAIAALALDADAMHATATAALITFFGVTLAGTVPINKALLAWRIDAPPDDWRDVIRRWERLDDVRCWAALVAFGSLVGASWARA